MIVPLVNYLRVISNHKWLKLGLLAAMVLIGVSAIGSQSRGAFLAAGAMVFYFWTKSDKKLVSGIALIVISVSIFTFMPQSWHDRMDTINTYEKDSSAMGRVNAWWEAFNVANANLLGAGFDHTSPAAFAVYAPNPDHVQGPHSIYFQVLAGHGWIGLAMFLAYCILSLRLSKKIVKKTQNIRELNWANVLSRMVYVSLIAYAVGGAFLALAYFDLPYHLIGILIVTNLIVDRELRKTAKSKVKTESVDHVDSEQEQTSLGKGLTGTATYNRY